MISAGLLLTGVAVALPAHAQEACECDHMLDLSVTGVNGNELGVQPGDVVCVAAGERPFLRLNQLIGTEDDPITVINCGGVARIHNTDRAYALVVEGQSQYVHITGTGDPAYEYGFDVSAPDRDPYPGVGVWLQGRSSDIEVDHVHVHDTGFAGVMAKTDPGCDDLPFWDDFVMRNIHLHHLWVHDTGGEGFYVGSTQSAGYGRTCDGQAVTIPAHFMENVAIDHVLVEDTGWDGAQVGFARSGCKVHDNVIRRVGLEGEMYQQQGLQIGAYSACEVRRNILGDGPAMGIIVLDSGDSLFADNVIARFAGDGIYANLRDLVETAQYRMIHNTIVDFGGSAVRVFGSGVQGAVAWNNLVIGGDEGSIAAGGDVGFEAADNVFAASVAEAGVMGEDDFHLLDGSPARGAGRELADQGFDVDLDGRQRARPPSVGAYEHAADAPEPPDAGAGGPDAPDAGVPASTPDAGGNGGGPADMEDGAGGCGCTVGGAAGSTGGSGPVLLAGVAMLGLLWRGSWSRRRRRAWCSARSRREGTHAPGCDPQGRDHG